MFIFWMNPASRQVGITYMGSAGRTSLHFFNNVKLPKGVWVKITLKFRKLSKRRPSVELFVGENRIDEYRLNRNFKDKILGTNRDNITIKIAEMFGASQRSGLPKVCFLNRCKFSLRLHPVS